VTAQPGLDAAAVEATMDQVSAALDAGDVEAFVASWTDAGLEQVFSETTATFATQTGYYVEAIQWSLGPTTDTVVTGTSATTVAPLFFRLVGAPRRFSLVNDGVTWRIDGADLTTADTGDATVVDVTFDGVPASLTVSEVPDGDIALNVHNATQVVHEVNIITVPVSRDMTAFFEHPELEPPLPEGRSMPEGMDFIGGIHRIAAGATVTVLLQRALPPGRYVLFCNAGDEAGDEHSRAGEFFDFTVSQDGS
jgi:hypothetical protein